MSPGLSVGRRSSRAPARPAPPVAPVARADRFSAGDLLVEATADLSSRPGRLVMTLLGTVIGIASLVLTVGFAQTTAQQLAQQFNAFAATQLVVVPAEAQVGSRSVATSRLPWDAVDRVERLAGVQAAAVVAEVTLPEGATITAVPVNDPSQAPAAPPRLFAASAELLDTVEGTVTTGRAFDTGHDRRGDRVAVLGARAAERLGVSRVDTQPSIFVDGLAYAVVGIFDGVAARAELLDGVVIPTGAARQDFRLPVPGEVRARVVVDSGAQVGEQVALALAPDDPDGLEVRAPAGRSELARDVEADVNVVFLVLSGVVLLAGAVGIASVTTLSVLERTSEIGLRRALGATPRQIAGQFMTESVVVGLLGGLLGAAVGVLALLAVCLVQGWAPVVNPLVALGGVVLGGVVGVLAGGFPARRASRIEPVVALRGS
ncbi:ABC transporter permease [Kineococcus sp. SYSU DK001]|uniref:ABC transporter permease n=1 Tax=Kineococcus sp. SYSU DK001 TaxID=3383122 RepID=UPI003D7D25A1